MRPRLALAALMAFLGACGQEGGIGLPTPQPFTPPPPLAVATPSPTPLATTTPTATQTPQATTVARACQNSTDQACGAFRWDPSPGANAALAVEIDVMPEQPRADRPVTFIVTGNDPDARFVFAGTWGVDNTPVQVVDTSPTGGCPRGYGAWTLPARVLGSFEERYMYTFDEPGTYEVFFTAYSNSYTVEEHPWPNKPPGDDRGFCETLDPLASFTRRTVEVKVSG